MEEEDMENQIQGADHEDAMKEEDTEKQTSSTATTEMAKKVLLLVNFTLMVVGAVALRILVRYYFLHGGRLRWLSSWTVSGGWPVILVPLAVSYFHRQRSATSPVVFMITWRLAAASAAVGLLQGLFSILYVYGLSYVPLSTAALLITSQLCFTSVFSFFMVKQRFTPYSVNAIVLLSASVLALGINANHDRPGNESRAKYYAGFGLTIGSMAAYAFMMTVTELVYAKMQQAITYTLLMEMQLVRSFAATLLGTVGMWNSGEFQEIASDAKGIDIGV